MDAMIIGIFGLQGWGKTALATYLGARAKKMGYKIFSNYHLNFPYTPVTTLEDAKKVRNGWLLLDEIWQWVHARTSQSKINKEMMEICLLNRKRGVSIIYNSQLKRTVDVILRDVTNYLILPQMHTHSNNKRYIHYVMRDLIGRYSKELVTKLSIDEIGKMFNTREEIGKLTDKKTPKEIGIGYEHDFAKAVKKLKGVNYVEVIPNSGNGSSWSYDVIVYANSGVYAVDVKGSNKTHVYLTEYGEKLLKKIDNAYDHKAKPCIAFPRWDKKRLTIPSVWYLYLLHNNCYLKRLKSYPFYNKLVKNSDKLNNINFYKK